MHYIIQLRRFTQRINLLFTERAIAWGVCFAGLLAIMLIIADQLAVWYLTPLHLACLAVIGALGGFVYSRFRRFSDLAVARTIEQRCPCKEILSTAVALGDVPDGDPEFAALVTTHAMDHLATLRPTTVFPRRFARHHQIALATWGIAIILFVLPGISWFQSPETRHERLAMTEAGKQLEEQARNMRLQPELRRNKAAMQVARQMQKLGIALEQHRLPKKEALVRLNKLDEQLHSALQQSALAQDKLDQQGLRNAAEALKRQMANRPPTEREAAARARAKLAAGAPKQQLTPSERAALERENQLNALAKQLEHGDQAGARQSLQQLGASLSKTPLSPQERQQLAQTLQQLAQQTAKTSNQNLSQSARQAAIALRQGTPKGQQKAAAALRSIPPSKSTKSSDKYCANCSSKIASAKQMIAVNSMQSNAQSAGNLPSVGSKPTDSGGNGNNSNSGPGNGRSINGILGQQGKRVGATVQSHYVPLATDPKQAAYSIDTSGGPDQAGRSDVPYYQVYPEYRKGAEAAIHNEQIPPDQRQRVKAYFSALDPGADQSGKDTSKKR